VNIKIYIATHKEFKPPFDKNYVPIQGGKAIAKTTTSYQGDDVGDNISDLNKNFCELTVLYWAWKNDISSDFIGLVHYRRYFSKIKYGIDQYVADHNGNNFTLTDDKEIAASHDFSELEGHTDLILPVRPHVGQILQNYGASHHVEDLYLVREVIKKIYPDYVDAYDYTMQSVTHMYNCNMMITRREIFAEYCEWLFKILFVMKDMTFYRNYDDYQQRIFGFISERLCNVWLLRNRHRFCIGERHMVVVDSP
jgi:hypothetical protein